jgi:hypothetical protein
MAYHGPDGRRLGAPIKLLDGVWFGVGGRWLDSATRYISGPGFARMSFPVTGGLRPALTVRTTG